MKKLILLPKTDTVIICLPNEWIGIPIICNLEPVKKSVIINEMKMENKKNNSFRKHKRKTENFIR